MGYQNLYFENSTVLINTVRKYMQVLKNTKHFQRRSGKVIATGWETSAMKTSSSEQWRTESCVCKPSNRPGPVVRKPSVTGVGAEHHRTDRLHYSSHLQLLSQVEVMEFVLSSKQCSTVNSVSGLGCIGLCQAEVRIY